MNNIFKFFCKIIVKNKEKPIIEYLFPTPKFINIKSLNPNIIINVLNKEVIEEVEKTNEEEEIEKLLFQLPFFCYPGWNCEKNDLNSTYSFCLQTTNNRVYGFCLKLKKRKIKNDVKNENDAKLEEKVEVEVEEFLCIISLNSWFSMFFKILNIVEQRINCCKINENEFLKIESFLNNLLLSHFPFPVLKKKLKKNLIKLK
jgi:hypothetical protein